MTLQEYTQTILPAKNLLFRQALRIVGNVAEAEDVVQEVFIKAWKQRDKLERIQNVEAWLTQLTKNRSIDKLRSKHRRLEGFAEGFDVREAAPTPYEQTASNDEMSALQRLMYRLPDAHRRTLELRELEGMSYDEIADELNCTLDQVKTNLFRARRKMRTLILETADQ